MKKIIFATILSLLTLPAFAGDSSTGCGLGWQVAPKNSLISATTRTTTNATFFNQWLGTTSGTSGCARHSIVENHKESLHFAHNNADRLKMEMAMGKGEFISTYAVSFNCNEQGVSRFVDQAQVKFGQIFSKKNQNAFDTVEQTISAMKGDVVLSENCGLMTI